MSTETQPNTTPNPNPAPQPRSGGSGIVTGLLVTSVVVGSCVGLAAYVDYRLNTVEEMFASRSAEIVVNLEDSTKSIRKEVGDKSSILAKGILELTTKEDERHKREVELLKETQAGVEKTIEGTLASASEDLKTVLTEQSAKTEKSIQTLLAQSTETHSQKLDRIEQSVSQVESTLDSKHSSLVSTIQSVNESILATRNALASDLKNSRQALTELIQLANTEQNTQLAELAAVLDSVSRDETTTKLQNDFSKLALQVDAIQKDVRSSSSAVHELSRMVPDLSQSSGSQIEQLVTTSRKLESELADQISLIETRVLNMGQALEETTSSILKAMYDNSQGMEGAKVELKSRIATQQEATTSHIEQLMETVEVLSNELKSINITAKNTSFASPAYLEDMNAYQNSLEEVTRAFLSLRSTLSEELNTVLTQQTAEASDEQVNRLIEELILEVSSISDEIGGQLEILEEGMVSLKNTALLVGDHPASHAEASVVDASSGDVHPQQRTEEQLGFTLQ